MSFHTKKTKENKDQSVPGAVYSRENKGKGVLPFSDKRLASIGQKKSQNAANKSTQVKQLKSFQEMADNYTAKKQQFLFSPALNSSSKNGPIQGKFTGDLEGKRNDEIIAILSRNERLNPELRTFFDTSDDAILNNFITYLRGSAEELDSSAIFRKSWYVILGLPIFKRSGEKAQVVRMWNESRKLVSQEEKGAELQESLLGLQLQMEKWKSNYPEEVVKDSAFWEELTSWSTQLINSIADKNIQGQDQMTPKKLAESKKGTLTSMAIRITASNSRQYHTSPSEQRGDGSGGTYVDFAYERQVNKSKVDRMLSKEEVTPIAPLMRGNTKKTVEKNAAVVEKNLEAVCTEFAQLAATTLDGHGVRVEIIGSMKTNHNWVLLGRPKESNLEDPGTWGDGVAIVDCWWGAMYWESYGEMPQVIYSVWEHTGEYGNKPDASYWDSDASQTVNAGQALENEAISFQSAKNALSGLFRK